MRASRASAAFLALCAVVLSCPSGGRQGEPGQGAPADTVPQGGAPVSSDTTTAASDSDGRGVLALGRTWTALERLGDSLAIVEHCFGFVPNLSIALDSTPAYVAHGYGQDTEIFDVVGRQEDDTLLRLEIRSRYRAGPGTLQLVVRDRHRDVVEVSEEIDGQRRPKELFVSDRSAARFPRVPRPADCGQP